MVGVIPCSEEGKSYLSFDGLERVGVLWLSMRLCLELNNKIHLSRKHMSIFISRKVLSNSTSLEAEAHES